MNRLQIVRGSSTTASRDGGGGEGGGANSSTEGEISTPVAAPADALEIEVVIPDFSKNGAYLVRTACARETKHYRLRFWPRAERDLILTPIASPRSERSGCR